MRFDGKVLFATGGGSGLAEATARRFAAEGGRVAVADLDGARAEEVAGELGGVGVACDVADEAVGAGRGRARPRTSSAASTASSTRPGTPTSARSRTGRSSASTG